MRTLAEQRLDRYEADTNENEAALESMYRSRIWDDMSFALAAFPYWRAWIDLELARMVTGQGEKSQALKPARSGFKAASVQLFKPGLVYGGWLGLGYVELEGGRKDRAKEIFKKLEEALASEPDSPVRQAVSMELRMLDAKQGTVSRFAGKGGKYSDNDAPLIKNEAFAMLQQSRKTGGRPLEAAARLKAVIDASKIDDQLLSNMMTYAQELSGVDVGPYTDLAGAEFAMANEHWYNAMQKYAAFFKAVQPPADLDLSNYRYRWALAAYKSDIFEPAIDVLNKLLSNPRLSGELDEAGSKLLYAIYATRAQRGASEANQQKLREAAGAVRVSQSARPRRRCRAPHDRPNLAQRRRCLATVGQGEFGGSQGPDRTHRFRHHRARFQRRGGARQDRPGRRIGAARHRCVADLAARGQEGPVQLRGAAGDALAGRS
jgi:hypothetical protein